MRNEIQVKVVGIDRAEDVRRIMQQAFDEYKDRLVPPTGALTESLEDTRQAIALGGAVLAYRDNVPVGTARYRIEFDHLYVERVGVLPDSRGFHVGTAIMKALEQQGRSLHLKEIRLGVRASIPANVAFYERLGYMKLEVHPHPRGHDSVITLKKHLGD